MGQKVNDGAFRVYIGLRLPMLFFYSNFACC